MSQEPLPEIIVTELDGDLAKLWVNDYVNVILVRCGESAVLIDSGFEETKGQLKAKLEEMGVTRIEYLINTHADGDIIAHLPSDGIVYLGDIIIPESFPVVWLEYGETVGVERLSEVLGQSSGCSPTTPASFQVTAGTTR